VRPQLPRRCLSFGLLALALALGCSDQGTFPGAVVGVSRAATGMTGEQRPVRWLDVSPPAGERRSGRVLVYHEARKRAVLLDAGKLWEWTGQHWLEVPGGAGGPPSFDAAVYHPERQSIVTFGGSDGAQVYDQTWEWDGNQWSNRTLASARPAGRWGSAMAWDGHGGRIVMFGGFENPDYPFRASDASLWEWDAGSGGWTALHPASAARPPARGLHDMVWDPVRRRVVLFGSGPMDVWEWESGTMTWTERTLPDDRTLERQSHTAVYDTDRNVIVLVGGLGSTPERFALEWEGASGTFADLVSSARPHPGARILAAAAYDVQRRRLVVTSGLTSDWKQGFDDVWETGTQLTPAMDAGGGADVGAGQTPPAVDAAPTPSPDAAAAADAGVASDGPAVAPPSPADGGPPPSGPPEPGSPPSADAGLTPVDALAGATEARAARPGAYAGCSLSGGLPAGALAGAPAGVPALALVTAALAALLRRRRR
jgi:hypothetical protein